MERVIGLGAGGHAKVVIEILRLMGNWELTALLDANEAIWGTTVLGVPVVGDDGQLPLFHKQGVRNTFIGLGSVGDSQPRKNLYGLALCEGFQLVSAIHPAAVISHSAEIGNGISVMAAGVINSSARIGNNVIINTGAIIEHDCEIGDHCHVATAARLASTVCLGSGVHIGAGATVRQSIKIGEGAIVGAGAVVVKDVEPWTVVAGVPARLHRHLTSVGLDGEQSKRDE